MGFHKKATGKRCIDWPQSVDEAPCFGWIDGVRHSLGEESYTIRFTPRCAAPLREHLEHHQYLPSRGADEAWRMQHAGLAAFERRSSDRSAVYAYEHRASARLAAAETRAFKAHASAWEYFSGIAPSYEQKALFWVTSVRKPETRMTRLGRLIAMAEKRQEGWPMDNLPGQVRIRSTIRGFIIGGLLSAHGLVPTFSPSFAALFIVGAAVQVGVLLLRKFLPPEYWPRAQYVIELIADAATVVPFAVAVSVGIARVPQDV